MSSKGKWVNAYSWQGSDGERHIEVFIDMQHKIIKFSEWFDNPHMDSGDKTFTFTAFIDLHKNGPEYNHIIKHTCGNEVCLKIIETISI